MLRGRENADGNKQEQVSGKHVFVHGLFSDGANNSDFILTDINMVGEELNEVLWKEAAMADFEVILRIFLGEYKRPSGNLSLNGHSPKEDSNSWSPEYGERMISARPRYSVRELKKESWKEKRK